MDPEVRFFVAHLTMAIEIVTQPTAAITRWRAFHGLKEFNYHSVQPASDLLVP
jgi:hypothetical protein